MKGYSMISLLLGRPNESVPVLEVLGVSSSGTGLANEVQGLGIRESNVTGERLPKMPPKRLEEKFREREELKKRRDNLSQPKTQKEIETRDELTDQISALDKEIAKILNESESTLKKPTDAVRKSISRAIDRLRSTNQDMAKYLDRSITIGYECIYTPPHDQVVNWVISDN